MSSKLNTSHIKDKNGPKRSRSAYLFFCTEERIKIKEELPDLTPREVMFELGRRWKKTKTEGDISRWEEMATKDKKRYNEEIMQKERKEDFQNFKEAFTRVLRKPHRIRAIEFALQHWEEEALKQLAVLLAIEPITTSDMEDFNIEQELRLRALADSFAHHPAKLCNLFGLDLAERGWNPGSWIGYFQILRGVRLSMDSGGLAIMCRNDVTCDDDSSVEEHLAIGAPCEYVGVYQIWGNVSELPKRLGKHTVTARLARLGCGSKAKGE